MDISIIIVNYNTRKLIHNCLQSIINNTEEISYEIIVIDNNSNDGSQNMIREIFPDVTLIQNNENTGFSRANNIGYHKSNGRLLLFLNSDTIIHVNAINKMVSYLERHNSIGVLGPKILNHEGKPTHSFQRFLDAKKLFFGSKYFKYILDVNKYHMNYSLYDFNSVQEVEWLSGACLLIRRDAFEKAGGWDENYYFYCEDMDLCYQIIKQGYSVVFYPEAMITHLFGQSTKLDSKTVSQLKKKSKKYFFKKNYSFIHYCIASFYLNLF